MRFKVVVLGSVLTCAALASVAMTLGRARGAAWIGQPLSLVVPVQIEAGQTAASLCAEADVFHAENKLESSRVTVTVEPTAEPELFNLRIASSSPIDEPVVTVYLRAGCAQKTTRRFVLLADYPSDTLPPVAAVPTEAALAKTAPARVQDSTPPPLATTSNTTTVPAQGLSAGKAENPSAAKSSEKIAPGKPAAANPVAVPKPAATKPSTNTAAKPAPTPSAKSPDASRSRLKLDPLENLAERIKTLEATTSSVPLEEMVRDSQRIQQLQNDVKALLDQAAKNEASLQLMRERLERAEAERISSTVVWVLGALILACLAAIAALWNRRSVATPSAWQQSIQEGSHMATQSAPESTAGEVVRPVKEEYAPVDLQTSSAPNSTILTPIAPASMDVDVNLMDMDSDFSRLIAEPSGAHPMTQVMEYQPKQTPDTRTIHRDFNSDSLADVRQQAEFFEKLGKVDQAIDVLEQRIRLNSKEAPLLYLDLLGIAHSHDLKTDFRQFRDEFEQMFNVRVPEFALFREEGRSLESHASLMQHVCKLWPTASVLDVIETCVVRDPWEKNAEPFDIGAFRDLILLHGIASRLQRAQDPAQSPSGADSQHVDIDL